MNERIKQLAEQAREFATTRHPVSNIVLSVNSEKFEEKFAELIVKECMDAVREQYLPVLEDAVMMKDTHWDGYVQCGVDSYVAIREQFGVEL
jgi:hypothetical protein